LTLAIYDWEWAAEHLQMVVSCPNLERLLIGEMTSTHEQLALLEKVSHLRQLELPELYYRPDLAADLRRLKSVKTLAFFRRRGWSDIQISRLRQDLPDVELIVRQSAAEQAATFYSP
jgi:hypothetical protein